MPYASKADQAAYQRAYAHGIRTPLPEVLLPEVSEIERAWAAGLYEGEGSISIMARSRNNKSFLYVSVANTDRTIVEFFHVRWGGQIQTMRRLPNHRQAWRWIAAARKAERFLQAIEPYLRTEKYRAKVELGLRFQAQKCPPGRPFHARPEYVEAQEVFRVEMRRLNAAGRGVESEATCTDPPEKKR